jgi:EpsD family peptidyl-prolyl cis-trans isomerase
MNASTNRWLLAAALSALIAGCNSGSQQPTQVALRVNGDEVSIHQVELALGARAASMPPAAASAATPAMLASLVDQELAAQAARQQGLDREPQVIQQLEAARRQVLAQAYHERVGARAIEASSDEIDRYYDEHPELFAKRRMYQLQETTVAHPAGQFDELKRTLEAAPSLARVQEQLARAGLKSAVRQLSISAEDVPLGLLSKLARLNEGESLMLPRDGGARVLTLIDSQAAPLNREVSRRLIAQYLVNERRRDLVAASMKALRGDAKVEYLGRYAALAPDTKAQPAQPRP